MRKQLTIFETRLENMIERLFHGEMDQHAVLRSVKRTFEEAIKRDKDGRWQAPNALVLRLHPADLATLQREQPNLDQQLAAYLIELTQNLGATLTDVPQIRLVETPTQKRFTAHVEALNLAPEVLTGTAEMPLDEDLMPKEQVPVGANLYTPENYRIRLNQAVINIGRRRDNHVVLDDSRVSRQHCQIRVRHGRFVIYDLNSRHGTTINGTAIREQILKSGDVISLGGLQLVYREEIFED